MGIGTSSLNTVLCKAVEGKTLDRREIRYLLGLQAPQEVELLQRVARLVRSKYFGQKVFLYGFVYFSTYCKNNCNFCNYRKDNSSISRYRKTEAEILEAALHLRDSGVHLIDLTMGEDPAMFHPDFGLKRLSRLVQQVKKESELPVMVSPGAIPEEAINELAKSGCDWFALYQETHSKPLFKKLRTGQSFEKRLEAKLKARDEGLLLEEGILTGVGETLEDIADSIAAMTELGAAQVRAMTFVSQPGTPMEHVQRADDSLELNIISVLRLTHRDALIPASLDIDGLSGLQKRLRAGANVVTSIVPPGRGLNGVANSHLDIEESRRTVVHIHDVLQFIGMEPATVGEYKGWLRNRKLNLKSPLRMGGQSINGRYWA